MRGRVSVAVPAVVGERDSVWVNLSGGVRVWVLASAPPPPGECVWVSVLVNDRVLVCDNGSDGLRVPETVRLTDVVAVPETMCDEVLLWDNESDWIPSKDRVADLITITAFNVLSKRKTGRI
eukprot:gene2660-biopygen11601